MWPPVTPPSGGRLMLQDDSRGSISTFPASSCLADGGCWVHVDSVWRRWRSRLPSWLFASEWDGATVFSLVLVIVKWLLSKSFLSFPGLLTRESRFSLMPFSCTHWHCWAASFPTTQSGVQEVKRKCSELNTTLFLGS